MCVYTCVEAIYLYVSLCICYRLNFPAQPPFVLLCSIYLQIIKKKLMFFPPMYFSLCIFSFVFLFYWLLLLCVNKWCLFVIEIQKPDLWSILKDNSLKVISDVINFIAVSQISGNYKHYFEWDNWEDRKREKVGNVNKLSFWKE